MTIISHGIDLVEIARIRDVLERHGDRFMQRILTERERQRAAEYKDPVPFIAGRWAAKESILKVIGTGWRGQIAWTDMEILPDHLGAPQVSLKGEVRNKADKLGIRNVLLSITHTDNTAAASAIAVGLPPSTTL